MGDWHENRNALNISTLNFSYQAAKLLNDLGLPVYFCTGNHDLYQRHTRELHSVIPFQEFSNFIVVNEPMVVKHMGDGVLVSPYLFHNEYPNLVNFLKLPTWFGHFEFKGFVVTGYNITMPTGPDIADYGGPTIFSGHFHKRQSSGNVHYIGSIFPMDFSDAGQNDRGMMVYDHVTCKKTYIDWPDCPKYVRVKLSELADGNRGIPKNSRVKCVADIPISYEESNDLRQMFIQECALREFSIEESMDLSDALKGDGTQIDADDMGDVQSEGVDSLVIKMINSIDTPHIENTMLTQIYQQLKI
jgi:DNA repair exonuclease SbcCD nuclease subunit